MDIKNDWKLLKTGKIREVYTNDTDELVFYASDKISAFDKVLPTFIPDKGKILTEMSARWCEQIAEAAKPATLSDSLTVELRNIKVAYMPCDFAPGTPYAMFGKGPYEGRATLMKRLEMLPIECIVRGYLTGSGLKSYQSSGKVCGIELVPGLTEASKLPEAIYTPTTKAANGHDEHITYVMTADIIEKKFPGRGKELAKKAKDWSLAIYRAAEEYARHRGIIIADTKFEFGVGSDGEMYLADEVLTPDSSRFWPADGYAEGKPQQSFDKQVVRDFLTTHPGASQKPLPDAVVTKTIRRYHQAYDMLFH